MTTLTSFDITSGTRILILPLGAWEQHGPHLPLNTDSLIIEAVVAHALEKIDSLSDEFLVAPTLAITASDEHDGFAGGLSCGTDALVASVVRIARAARWARGVCIVNGHGGNADALARIASALDYENIAAHIWSLPSYSGGDMHAGRTETSLLLHLHPEFVREESIEQGKVAITQQDFEVMRSHGIQAISPNGVLGDPRSASSAHGVEVLNVYTESLVASLHHCLGAWPQHSSE